MLNYSASLHDDLDCCWQTFCMNRIIMFLFSALLQMEPELPRKLPGFQVSMRSTSPNILICWWRLDLLPPGAGDTTVHLPNGPPFHYRSVLTLLLPLFARRQSQLALGVEEQALEEIRRHLLDFIGTYTGKNFARNGSCGLPVSIVCHFFPIRWVAPGPRKLRWMWLGSILWKKP